MHNDITTGHRSRHILSTSAAIGTPAVIAHRGASHDAPENTVAAFNLAWQQGADGIEGDFHLTKDCKIVCIHDATTQRTATQAIKIAEATLADLRQLDVGSWKGEQWHGSRIPTINEVLATVPEGKKVFIELKCGPEILPTLEKELADAGFPPDQTNILSFNPHVIAETKRRLPQLKALWLTAFYMGKNAGIVSPSAKEIVATLEKTGADGVNCHSHPTVDQQFMQALRTAQKEVHIWTVDDVEMAKRFMQLGIDSLTSNCAGWLKQQLNNTTDNLGSSNRDGG